MLAKAVAHGPDRRAALARLDRGLGELVLLGPGTNVAYLRALLARPEVRGGEIDTALIERLGEAIAPPPAREDLPRLALLELLGEPASDDPWDALDAWRATGPGTVRAELESAGETLGVSVGPAERLSSLAQRATKDRGPGVRGYRDGDGVWLLDGGAEPRRFALRDADEPHVAAAAAGSLEAPMPGTVIDVRCGPGDAVAEGDVLVVVESMKMEMAVQSAAAGTVAEVLVEAGDRVARGQLLVALTEEEEAE